MPCAAVLKLAVCCCAAAGNPDTVTLVTKFRSGAGPAQRVKITPTQFHFHTRGEHMIDGE